MYSHLSISFHVTGANRPESRERWAWEGVAIPVSAVLEVDALPLGHRGFVVFVCWLLNIPATCECISETDLLRQIYVLPY